MTSAEAELISARRYFEFSEMFPPCSSRALKCQSQLRLRARFFDKEAGGITGAADR